MCYIVDHARRCWRYARRVVSYPFVFSVCYCYVASSMLWCTIFWLSTFFILFLQLVLFGVIRCDTILVSSLVVFVILGVITDMIVICFGTFLFCLLINSAVVFVSVFCFTGVGRWVFYFCLRSLHYRNQTACFAHRVVTGCH